MSSVFHRVSDRRLPTAVSGAGAWITDEAGRRFLDASSGGVAVCALGHGHPKVSAAIRDQLDRLCYFHGSVFTTRALEELADELGQGAPLGLNKIFFVSGGSEAIETAVMLARQFAVETGQSSRTHLVSRYNSYHGATLTALSLGDNTVRRAPFQDMFPGTSSKVSPCYAYRDQRSDETAEAFGERLALEFEAHILERGSHSVLAFIAETVGGSSSGALVSPPGYLRKIRQICDRYGILLILDEVFCGMGRTGVLHACTAEDVVPDLLAVAKGLGSGFAPIGAVFATSAIHDVIAKGSGSFKGGFTYSGHAIACAAALAVQQVIRTENILENVVQQGARLRSRLNDRFANHHLVGDVRGRGLLQAIELVADRSSKAPFGSSVAARIQQESFARGLLCLAASGTIDVPEVLRPYMGGLTRIVKR